MALTLGARLGPYEVIAAIGQGGMGEVYRAKDTKLGRDVALKILPDVFAHDPERLVRFGREAQVLASRDGREIFVNNLGTLQALEITTEPRLDWTNPVTLFSVQGLTAAGQGSTNYDVIRDGRQFVMVVPVGTEAGNMTQEIHIVLNWTEELKRLVPTP